MPLVYVALGDSTVYGLGASSPSTHYVARLFASLQWEYPAPRLTNLGACLATAADVLAQQVPDAVLLRPHLVTLSVGPNDLRQGRSPDDFARRVEVILERLDRETDATVILNAVPDMAAAPTTRRTPVMQRGPARSGKRCGHGSPNSIGWPPHPPERPLLPDAQHAFGRLSSLKFGHRFFTEFGPARLVATFRKVLGEMSSRVNVAIANEGLTGRLRAEPRKRPISYRRPEVDQVTEQCFGLGRRRFERNPRVAGQLDRVERIDVGGRPGNGLSSTGLDQGVTKPCAPAGDVGHEEACRPPARKIWLGGSLGDEPPLRFPFCLEQPKNILHLR